MRRVWKIAVTATLVVLLAAKVPEAAQSAPPPAAMPAFDGSLSVLTYNVKGLPWPVALGRSTALTRIGDRLRSLHAQGKAPAVVVLQEAFTDHAQAIGRSGGYRFIVNGPTDEEVNSLLPSRGDDNYAADARWWKGETEGKFVGSGLQVLSDYPIVAVKRMAFPDFACAGYDCLANKGALLVTLRIPGAPTPVEVLTTHLNSRHASGVEDARSNAAYRLQVDALTTFVRRAHDPRYPLIAAGDYNVGSVPARQADLLGAVHREWLGGSVVRDALGQFERQGGELGADASWSLRRARDWQFYADGTQGRLTLTGIEVLFGHDASGDMLSDHVGYVARFGLSAATSSAKPTG
jgi:hypothetical protein